MDDEVQLISDGDGLAVIGPRDAAKLFLKSVGLWAESQELDLRRLLSVGAGLAQTASEAAANSCYWFKLTDQSARLYREHGLMPSKTPGQSHLMIGKPGKVQNWLQTEQGPGSLLTNPATLSGLSGLMAQAALRQSMAEAFDYLATLDHKADDVLRKVDDAEVARMVGVGHAIERAMTIREQTGTVNETLWSTVDQAHQTIGATQAYALAQLDALAERLESTKVGDLAQAAAQAERDVRKWLALLARCSMLHDAVDVLELDRVLAEAPQELPAYRSGLQHARQQRGTVIAEHTRHLLDRMDLAVDTANAKIVWNRKKSVDVVRHANQLAPGIHDFHVTLSIESEPRAWDARQLGRGADIGSQVVQVARDTGPVVATGAGVLGFARVMKTRPN
jgi:hypothetical protein